MDLSAITGMLGGAGSPFAILGQLAPIFQGLISQVQSLTRIFSGLTGGLVRVGGEEGGAQGTGAGLGGLAQLISGAGGIGGDGSPLSSLTSTLSGLTGSLSQLTSVFRMG